MMALISPTKHDTAVIGLGLLVTCTILVTMRQMLTFYRKSAIVPPSENKPQYITQDVEDSLKLSTLEKLLDSPSWVIRDTTSIIICERALHDENSFATILLHISRPEYALREKGIRALHLMMNNTVAIRFLHSPKGYAALVKCLEYCVTDYEHNDIDADWDNWAFRDVVEQFALSILIRLIQRFGTGFLVRYRFVDHWLVKEPWGQTISERQTKFAKLVQANNQKLSDIVSPISRHPAGLKQLQRAQLIPDEFADTENSNGAQDGLSMASDSMDILVADIGRRIWQRNTGEYMRRRHREAMVLNDGSRPLGIEDIIQRER